MLFTFSSCWKCEKRYSDCLPFLFPGRNPVYQKNFSLLSWVFLHLLCVTCNDFVLSACRVVSAALCIPTVPARLWAGVCVSLSVDTKPQEKRRPPHHHRFILRSPSNSHTPARPPLSPPSSSSSSSSSVCAAGSCPLPASVSMTGLYSLQPPSLSTLLPSLQALPRPGLLSKLSPLLLQSLPPAASSPTGPTPDWIWLKPWNTGHMSLCEMIEWDCLFRNQPGSPCRSKRACKTSLVLVNNLFSFCTVITCLQF